MFSFFASAFACNRCRVTSISVTAMNVVAVAKEVCYSDVPVSQPTSDDNFDGVKQISSTICDIVSLIKFSNVVYDRLSAETVGNDGEALTYGVAYWSEQRRHLKVQAVNDDGSRTTLDANTLKAIKPDQSGLLVEVRFVATCPCALQIRLECPRIW